MRGIGIFSPPLMTTRTDERSRCSISGRAMIALTMAGASHTVVTRERSISSTTSEASNDRWTIVVAPAAISEVVVRSSAPTWYSGPQANPRSALVKPNSTVCARFFQARLAWVSMTPLGRPVVPDVYINRWTSSAPAATPAPSSDRHRRSPRDVHAALGGLARCWRGRAGPRGPPSPRSPAAGGTASQTSARGTRVLEDVAHLGRGEPPVDRHGDGAEVVGGEQRLEELGAVVREECHDVARTDAARGQAARPARPHGRPSPGRSSASPRRSSSPCPACGRRGGRAR